MENSWDVARMQFVEDVSLALEEGGMASIGGRILGWLVVCSPPQQTIGDLTKALNVSKASVSNMTRMLEQMDLIERVRLPGQRQVHFQLKGGSWLKTHRQQMGRATRMRQLADRGLVLMANASHDEKARIWEMVDLFEFWEVELPGLMKRLETYLEKRKRERKAQMEIAAAVKRASKASGPPPIKS